MYVCVYIYIYIILKNRLPDNIEPSPYNESAIGWGRTCDCARSTRCHSRRRSPGSKCQKYAIMLL